MATIYNSTDRETAMKYVRVIHKDLDPNLPQKGKHKVYFIDKMWDDLDDFLTSDDYKDFFECYENVMRDRIRLYKKWTADGTYQFLGAYKIGDRLYMEHISDGIRFLSQVSISCCIDNGGFNEVAIIENLLLLHEKNWSPCNENRALFRKSNAFITKLYSL